MYSSSHTYNACDYVTVFGTNATFSNGVFTWDVPPEYFSNQRGTLCTVQIVSGQLNATTQTPMAFLWMSGAANANHVQSPVTVEAGFNFKVSGDNPTAKMTNTPIIATGSQPQNHMIEVKGGPEFLTPARPSQIKIGIVSLNRNTGLDNVEANKALALVFKFTYYDAITSAVELHNHQYTKTL